MRRQSRHPRHHEERTSCNQTRTQIRCTAAHLVLGETVTVKAKAQLVYEFELTATVQGVGNCVEGAFDDAMRQFRLDFDGVIDAVEDVPYRVLTVGDYLMDKIPGEQ